MATLSSDALLAYFQPVPNNLPTPRVEPTCLGEQIHRLHDQNLLEDYLTVFIGLPDADQKYASANAIRERLYRLSPVFETNRLLELGNLQNPNQQLLTNELLGMVVQYFLDRGIFVLLIAGAHTFELGHYMAYQGLEKQVTLLTVDNRIDLSLSPQQAHLDSLFANHPNYLFHYIHLGYQSYLVRKQVLAFLEEQRFEAIRLGNIRENLLHIEPALRSANFLSFDAAALNKQYAPGAKGAEIFGLTGEEACQMSWYAGLSSRLQSAGLHGYELLDDDPQRTTAMTLATMIWYLIEGIAGRKHQLRFEPQEYTRYNVAVPGADHTIIFYKSLLAERWWMEVPFDKDAWAYQAMVPCSYSDYLTAQRGELPPRWLLMYDKMN